jgi:hypothetical protein
MFLTQFNVFQPSSLVYVDMGLGVDISFEQFLIDLNVNEENYIFAL